MCNVNKPVKGEREVLERGKGQKTQSQLTNSTVSSSASNKTKSPLFPSTLTWSRNKHSQTTRNAICSRDLIKNSPLVVSSNVSTLVPPGSVSTLLLGALLTHLLALKGSQGQSQVSSPAEQAADVLCSMSLWVWQVGMTALVLDILNDSCL